MPVSPSVFSCDSLWPSSANTRRLEFWMTLLTCAWRMNAPLWSCSDWKTSVSGLPAVERSLTNLSSDAFGNLWSLRMPVNAA